MAHEPVSHGREMIARTRRAKTSTASASSLCRCAGNFSPFSLYQYHASLCPLPKYRKTLDVRSQHKVIRKLGPQSRIVYNIRYQAQVKLTTQPDGQQHAWTERACGTKLDLQPPHLSWKHPSRAGPAFTPEIEMKLRSRARERRPQSWVPMGSTLTQRLHAVASRDPGSSEEVESLTGRCASDNREGQCTVWFHNRTQPVHPVQFQPNRIKKQRKEKEGKNIFDQDSCL